MNERPGPDLVTAIIAVFVGGVGVSIASAFTAPILVARPVDNLTAYLAVHLGLVAVGSVLGALFVCGIFGFTGQPTYARAFAALLVGEMAGALVLFAQATSSNPHAAIGISPFGWLGFALSVFILMSAPRPKDRGRPQWEYKLPPGAVWAADAEQDERRRRRES